MLDIFTLATSLSASLCANEIATLRAAADRIEATYVIEEVADRVANELRSLADETASRPDCASKQDFANALTTTLRTISDDGHFYVEETTNETVDEWIPRWRASGYQSGQGITHIEILDGNIGYIRIKSFFELEPAFPHYRAAFEMVKDTNALILDLRDNHGGSSQTAWPAQWTFLTPGSASPMSIESRVGALKPRDEPSVLWRRYGTKRPLAIVINHDTFSAPEAVAYTLQIAGRATIVGEQSGGGAHMLDEGDDLPTGFTLYTPTSRPISVATGQNWEGTGITPDISAANTEAVNAAADYLRKEINSAL